MSNKALNRKVYIICGSLLAMLLVLLGVIAINKLNYRKTLLSEGIRTNASVLNKYHVTSNTGKIKRSYLELAVFEDTTTVAKQKVKEINKEPKSINDKIDILFENFGTSKTPTTEYKSLTYLVSLEQYGSIKIGESKTFVYLKGEVENGVLLDALE
ncbi:hypothetical protein [Psychroserpens sp.]|uniref:hypothetical protein n=1 Tax=Psychroserpens sp. TaxID=2020870 RepID=UPI002B26B20B|nr:hypothetical protein [Psychroserpens sp.]